MKIVIAHNRYQQPGGEDTVVRQDAQLLREAGHEVVLYDRSNDELNSFSGVQRLTLLARTVWASDTLQEFYDLLLRERPDVVHVHNTFVMISPAIYEACKSAGVPVVQTLHNYRLFCPASTFLRDGKPCEDCVSHSLLSSIRHRCYRQSASASAALAATLSVHRWRGTWTNDIDRYIALTEFARNKFEQCGLPSDKLVVKPNFVHPDPGQRQGTGQWALFMGRLTGEKGIFTAIKAWEQLPAQLPLKVVGDGPLMQELRAYVTERNVRNIEFLGQVTRERAFAELAGARFLVFPSEWYESFPMTLLEAFAHGVPVIASDMGVMPEIVIHGHTGLLFPPGDAKQLAAAALALWNNLDMAAQMGKHARHEFEAKYTAKTNLRQSMDIYSSVIRSARLLVAA